MRGQGIVCLVIRQTHAPAAMVVPVALKRVPLEPRPHRLGRRAETGGSVSEGIVAHRYLDTRPGRVSGRVGYGTCLHVQGERKRTAFLLSQRASHSVCDSPDRSSGADLSSGRLPRAAAGTSGRRSGLESRAIPRSGMSMAKLHLLSAAGMAAELFWRRWKRHAYWQHRK